MSKSPAAFWPLPVFVAGLGLAFSLESHDPLAPKLVAAWASLAAVFGLAALETLGTRALQARPRRLDRWVPVALAGFGVLALASEHPWCTRESAWCAALSCSAYGAARIAIAPTDLDLVSLTFGATTLVAVALGAAYVAVPGAFGFTFLAPGGWQARTLASTMANPDYFAAWLLLAIPLVARLAAGRWRRAAHVMLAAAGAALVLTFSRAGWLGIVASALVGRQIRTQRPFSRKAVLAALVAAGLAVALLPALAAKLTRTGTLLERFAIWKGAISIAARRPLLGCGPGAFGVEFPEHRPPDFRATGLPYVNNFAHDLPLHVLAVGGALGLALLAAGLLALAADARRPSARHAALAGVLAQNLFSVTLCVTPLAALFAFVAGLPDEPAPGAEPARSSVEQRPLTAAALVSLACLAAAGYVHAAVQYSAGCELKAARQLMDAGAQSAGEAWHAGAIAHLTSALSRGPFEPAARYRLAATKAFEGDWAGAQAEYVLLEAIAGAYAELPRDRAEVYRAWGRSGPALLQAKRWTDMNAADPAGHVLSAHLFEETGQRERALENALRARSLGMADPALAAMIDRLSRR